MFSDMFSVPVAPLLLSWDFSFIFSLQVYRSSRHYFILPLPEPQRRPQPLSSALVLIYLLLLDLTPTLNKAIPRPDPTDNPNLLCTSSYIIVLNFPCLIISFCLNSLSLESFRNREHTWSRNHPLASYDKSSGPVCSRVLPVLPSAASCCVHLVSPLITIAQTKPRCCCQGHTTTNANSIGPQKSTVILNLDPNSNPLAYIRSSTALFLLRLS